MGALKEWWSPTKKTHVCASCGSEVRAMQITPGSFGTELLLWLLFLLPGLIYSIWRIAGRYTGCPVCDSRNLVPIGTPMANQILESHKSSNVNLGAGTLFVKTDAGFVELGKVSSAQITPR
jgi:DNA-directed RNA polymerase subunit RPC12/RpoP